MSDQKLARGAEGRPWTSWGCSRASVLCVGQT